MTMTALQKLSNVKSQRMRLSLLQPPLPQFYLHDSFLHSKWFSFLFLSNVCYSSNLLSPLTVGELSLCTDISLLTQNLCVSHTWYIFFFYTHFNALHFGDLQFQHVTNQSRIFFHGTILAGDIISFLNWQTCNSDRYSTNHVWGRG